MFYSKQYTILMTQAKLKSAMSISIYSVLSCTCSNPSTSEVNLDTISYTKWCLICLNQICLICLHLYVDSKLVEFTTSFPSYWRTVHYPYASNYLPPVYCDSEIPKDWCTHCVVPAVYLQNWWPIISLQLLGLHLLCSKSYLLYSFKNFPTYSKIPGDSCKL